MKLFNKSLVVVAFLLGSGGVFADQQAEMINLLHKPDVRSEAAFSHEGQADHNKSDQADVMIAGLLSPYTQTENKIGEEGQPSAPLILAKHNDAHAEILKLFRSTRL